MLQDPIDLAEAFVMVHEQKRTAWSYVPGRLVKEVGEKLGG